MRKNKYINYYKTYKIKPNKKKGNKWTVLKK